MGGKMKRGEQRRRGGKGQVVRGDKQKGGGSMLRSLTLMFIKLKNRKAG